MQDDPTRRAETESLFRDVNERIAETADRFDASETDFICECADPGCTHRVEATLEEYERVRADATTFLLTPGHAQAGLERVRVDRGRFHVVEKLGATVRAIVRRRDPR